MGYIFQCWLSPECEKTYHDNTWILSGSTLRTKTCLETSRIKEKHKKRPQLTSNWAPWPPTNWSDFSPGALLRGQMGAMISQGCQKIPKWCHQCFQGVRKWLQCSKNRAECSQWGALLYIYIWLVGCPALRVRLPPGNLWKCAPSPEIVQTILLLLDSSHSFLTKLTESTVRSRHGLVSSAFLVFLCVSYFDHPHSQKLTGKAKIFHRTNNCATYFTNHVCKGQRMNK